MSESRRQFKSRVALALHPSGCQLSGYLSIDHCRTATETQDEELTDEWTVDIGTVDIGTLDIGTLDSGIVDIGIVDSGTVESRNGETRRHCISVRRKRLSAHEPKKIKNDSDCFNKQTDSELTLTDDSNDATEMSTEVQILIPNGIQIKSWRIYKLSGAESLQSRKTTNCVSPASPSLLETSFRVTLHISSFNGQSTASSSIRADGCTLLEKEEEEIEAAESLVVSCRVCHAKICKQFKQPKAVQLPSEFWTDLNESMVCSECPSFSLSSKAPQCLPSWLFLSHQFINLHPSDLLLSAIGCSGQQHTNGELKGEAELQLRSCCKHQSCQSHHDGCESSTDNKRIWDINACAGVSPKLFCRSEHQLNSKSSHIECVNCGSILGTRNQESIDDKHTMVQQQHDNHCNAQSSNKQKHEHPTVTTLSFSLWKHCIDVTRVNQSGDALQSLFSSYTFVTLIGRELQRISTQFNQHRLAIAPTAEPKPPPSLSSSSCLSTKLQNSDESQQPDHHDHSITAMADDHKQQQPILLLRILCNKIPVFCLSENLNIGCNNAIQKLQPHQPPQLFSLPSAPIPSIQFAYTIATPPPISSPSAPAPLFHPVSISPQFFAALLSTIQANSFALSEFLPLTSTFSPAAATQIDADQTKKNWRLAFLPV